MGSLIVLVALLCVFFMRDVQLLSTAPARHRLAVSIAYSALNALYLIALTALLISGHANRPLQLFHSSALWTVSVVWHCLIWATCLTLGGKGKAGRSWLVAMLPAPVLLVSMTALTFLLWFPASSIYRETLSLIVAVSWAALVSFAVLWINKRPGPTLGPNFALDFAGMTNATALVLVPLSGITQSF